MAARNLLILTVFGIFYAGCFVESFKTDLLSRSDVQNGERATSKSISGHVREQFATKRDEIEHVSRKSDGAGISEFISPVPSKKDLENVRKTSVPLIDETLDIEVATGLKLSDIPEGSVDSLWKTLFTGSGESTTLPHDSERPSTVSEDGWTSYTGDEDSWTTGIFTTDFEGSGDSNDTLPITFSTTTEITTTSEEDVTLPSTCFQYECNSSDLDLPGNKKFPKGTDISVTCTSLSYDKMSSLYWFWTNGSQSILMNSTSDREVNLTLLSARVHDSGIYKCIKLSENRCCYFDVHIHVYKMPNYENHFIIVGAVAVSFLITCLILVVWRNRREERQRKLMMYANGTKHELLGQS